MKYGVVSTISKQFIRHQSSQSYQLEFGDGGSCAKKKRRRQQQQPTHICRKDVTLKRQFIYFSTNCEKTRNNKIHHFHYCFLFFNKRKLCDQQVVVWPYVISFDKNKHHIYRHSSQMFDYFSCNSVYLDTGIVSIK